jgi:hypothetical protein
VRIRQVREREGSHQDSPTGFADTRDRQVISCENSAIYWQADGAGARISRG